MENECSKGRNRKYTQMDYEQPKRKLAHAKSSSLPSEIITEILIRLPIKILLRFQSVSKCWSALIFSPQFVKAHLVKNKDYTHQRIMRTCIGRQMNSIKVYPMQSLDYESVTNPYDLDCPLKNHFMIVGSVNGLICLAFGAHNFLIWNPSIRKFKKLAALEIASGFHIAGFGYDELRDDYKLVSIFCGVKVEIYSLKRNSWRKMDDFQVGEVKSRLPTLVNSKLHWVTRGGDILSIDLTDEKWGRLEHPFYGEGDDGFDLGVLKTDLSVFRYYERMTCGHVWVMKQYGVKESWTKIYTIKFSHSICTLWSPLFCMTNKGEVFLMFGTSLMIYNPKDGTIKSLKIADFSSFLSPVFYVESLVCPFADEPRIQQ